jgi:hypothetical protein
MEADIIKETRVHKRETEVWHPAQFYAAIDLGPRTKINLWGALSREKLTYPWISAQTVDPDLSIIASTSSITSK